MATIPGGFNLSANDLVSNATDYKNALLGRSVVKPKNFEGIGGFIFDYAGEVGVRMQSDITDHLLETNSSVQDHVAFRPTRVTMRGFVAELAVVKEGPLGALSSIQNKLTTLTAYLGRYTPGATQALAGALSRAQTIQSQIQQSVARGKNIVGLFKKGAVAQTKQQKALAQLEALRGGVLLPNGALTAPQIFYVETPYKIYPNMLIESVEIRQPEDTRYQSDIVVILKEVRAVSLDSFPNPVKKGGRAATMSTGRVDKGRPGATVKNLASTLSQWTAP